MICSERVRTLETSPLLMSAMDISGNSDGKKILKKSAIKKDGYRTSIPFITFDSPITIPTSVRNVIMIKRIKSHDGVNDKKSIKKVVKIIEASQDRQFPFQVIRWQKVFPIVHFESFLDYTR